MKLAIIGSGISGLTAAWHLQHDHEVTVFEAGDKPGGHTDTHTLDIEGQQVRVDSGFIVFNRHNYPNFCKMLDALGVEAQASDMSFSVVHEGLDLVYGAAGLGRLLARKRNLLRPDFYRMLWDLRRFYREAPALLDSDDDTLTLGEYLDQNGYSPAFSEGHILPMAAALWSSSMDFARHFPARYFVAFMANHRMLQVNERPQWLTVRGGSDTYVQALIRQFRGTLLTRQPVHAVRRHAGGVTLLTEAGPAEFDGVVMACHSDQALALLDHPSAAEQAVLGNIGYASNHVTVHHDVRQLPPARAAWASWNARVTRDARSHCQVSYWMNLLQNLPVKTPVIVSLNAEHQIDPDTIWLTRTYAHPQYTTETLRAQRRHADISGQQRTWYCGAYWGWGFHEDGVRSALTVVDQIQREATSHAA
ncbi:FAD-dependent oxidoreductase [Hahella sp. SMD15-11]|uniref:FAD-dependent oxidoreductase n=1 Tax=Thermohahella caldifontis TaxID=3142973 RepID=A0AB39USI3_9GAMM